MCPRIIDMMLRFQIYLECTILYNSRRIILLFYYRCFPSADTFRRRRKCPQLELVGFALHAEMTSEGLMTVHGRICRGDVYCDFALICPSHFYNKVELFSCVQIWQMIDDLKLTCPLIYSLHTCTLSSIPV